MKSKIYYKIKVMRLNYLQISSPACTELEVVMMDWLGDLIGLPKEFLAKHNSNGGGVIQVS